MSSRNASQSITSPCSSSRARHRHRRRASDALPLQAHAELAQPAIGLEEGLLADVARLLVVAHQAEDDPPDLAIPAAHERIEGGDIPRLERSDQLLVGRGHRPQPYRTNGTVAKSYLC